MNEAIQEYEDEFENDLKVDRITLMSVQETWGSVTHKWASRSFLHKQRIANLEKRKTDLVIEAQVELESSNDRRYKGLTSKTAKDRFIMNTEVVREIDNKIDLEKRILEYVDEVLNICKFTHNSRLDGILDLLKLEAMT